MASVSEPPAVELAAYRGRRNVVVWFSRGFTCPFCRSVVGPLEPVPQGNSLAELVRTHCPAG